MQVKKQQVELDMEQLTGSELGKEFIKAVYYHHAYYIMQNAGLDESKLESRLQGEISTTSDMQVIPL